MPKADADQFIDELLATSAIAYGLKDSRSPGIWLFGEQEEVAHYIARETGGVYLKVARENGATGLTQILRHLGSRYELGFQPEALDGKRHKLTVKLTVAGKEGAPGSALAIPACVCAGAAVSLPRSHRFANGRHSATLRSANAALRGTRKWGITS